MSISIKQINNRIQKQIGDVQLVKGKGYFYLTSEDEGIALYLASLYSTSIFVPHLKFQSVEEWVADVENIMSDYFI
jgi:hypothetical protein